MSTTPVAKCEECGYEVTTESKYCINCGEKIRNPGEGWLKSIFKRVLFLAIAIYILLSALKIVN